MESILQSEELTCNRTDNDPALTSASTDSIIDNITANETIDDMVSSRTNSLINSSSTLTANQSNKSSQIDMYLNLLKHSFDCSTVNCTYSRCINFKRMLEHVRKCSKLKKHICEFCKQFIALVIYHSKECVDPDCKIDFCSIIKLKIEQERVHRNKLSACKELLTVRLDYLATASKFPLRQQDLAGLEAKQTELVENLNKVENLNNNGEVFFNKKLREELVKYVFQLCLSKSNSEASAFKDVYYASLVAFLFKQENDLFNEANSKPSQVYMSHFSDMVYRLFNEFDKHLSSNDGKTDTQTLNTEAKDNQSRKKKSSDSPNEAELCGEYKPDIKRIKNNEYD
jgi:hypothetical protein